MSKYYNILKQEMHVKTVIITDCKCNVVSPLWMGTTSPSSDVTESRMRVPLTGDVCSSSTKEA